MDIVAECFGIARDRIVAVRPGLACALSALEPVAETGAAGVSTDGRRIYAGPEWTRSRFLSDPTDISAALAHMLMHVLLGHVGPRRVSDIAYDLQVALVLHRELPELLPAEGSGLMAEVIRRCGTETDPETLEYCLAEDAYLIEHRAELIRMLHVDEHSRWDRLPEPPPRVADGGLRSGGGGARAGGSRGGSVWRERPGRASGFAYERLLRRYAEYGEELREDEDSFDPGLYHAGLALYGNRPILEPSESREARRVSKLVLAIDTSGSCARGLTRAFLAETRAIMKRDELFRRRFELHVLQFDTEIRRDDLLRSTEDLTDYLREIELTGGGGTDFRPVFRHTDALIASGELEGLRGLIVFTDGRGIYPNGRPSYEATFVMQRDSCDTIDMPSWIRRILLEAPCR